VLVPRDFVVVSRAGHLKFGALCVGSIKGSQRKASGEGGPSSSPGEQSLTKHSTADRPRSQRLVLPDSTAKGICGENSKLERRNRIDQEHIGFEHLKITTYTPEDQPDLRIDMSTSVLDLKTRILSSKARTTIQRVDFNIAGDSVEFDTNSRTGRLMGM